MALAEYPGKSGSVRLFGAELFLNLRCVDSKQVLGEMLERPACVVVYVFPLLGREEGEGIFPSEL